MLFMEGITLYNTVQKIWENDLHKLWVSDYGYNEDTICLVKG